MIETKADFKRCVKEDMQFYNTKEYRERFICWATQDPTCAIAKYIRLLRKEEYYHNVRHDKFGKMLCLYYLSRKNRLGNKLGFKIPRNCIGPGLTIYHHGTLIINESARIGKNCKFHGCNCVGNNGLIKNAPVIGDNLDCGFGAVIIGGVKLEDGVKIGANAVVNKSFVGSDITLVGAPARKV